MHILKVLSLVFIFDLEENIAQQEFGRWNFSSFQELKVSYFLFYLCVTKRLKARAATSVHACFMKLMIFFYSW